MESIKIVIYTYEKEFANLWNQIFIKSHGVIEQKKAETTLDSSGIGLLIDHSDPLLTMVNDMILCDASYRNVQEE